jgi:predicted nucleic acid-binding Zn ribbon protein
MSFIIKQKRKGEMYSLKDVLTDIISEYKLENSFTIEDLRIMWSSIVGETIATHSRPDRIFKHTLFISTDHAIYANELMLMKDKIKKYIEEKYAYYNIKKLKFEIKRLNWNN